MKIVYCPPALHMALKAAGQDLGVLNSVVKLASILSTEDVAFYCYVNLSLESSQVLPPAIARSFPSAVALDREFEQGLAEGNPQLLAIKRQVADWVHNKNAPALFDPNVPMRLTCDLMATQDGVLFTHIPVPSDEVDTDPLEVNRLLMDRYIQQLRVMLPFRDVASNPAMAGYLRATQAVQSAGSAA